MARYVANRLAQAIMLLVIVSALGFAILHLAPGGPLSQFAASAQMTQEDLDRITKQLGLDRPLPIQYLDWFGRMLTGDWGQSYRAGDAVLSVIGSHRGAIRCSTSWRPSVPWWPSPFRPSGSGWSLSIFFR